MQRKALFLKQPRETKKKCQICTLSFMDYDPRRIEHVRASRNDQGMFSQCREIVMKFADELRKTTLPME